VQTTTRADVSWSAFSDSLAIKQVVAVWRANGYRGKR
jgi:hypothetical protein